MRGKITFAGGLLALAACVTLMSQSRWQTWDELEGRFAQVKAVGDDGCLGRSCNIDDKTARNDIDAYMDSLNKGPHAGHRPREARKRPATGLVDLQRFEDQQWPKKEEHLRGVEEMPAADAVKDLTSFFDKLDAHTHKTARVLASEKNEKHNARLSDKDDRKDLQRYYQTLTPKTQLLRQRVMSQELKATQHATLAHKQAEAAREREERKMEAEHAENEAAAAADHKRFVKESRQQLAKQETGHFMQVVPTAKLTEEEERAHEDDYMRSLPGKVARVVAREAREEKIESSHKQKIGFLSADAARAEQSRMFDDLNKKVHKTARVLAAEARSEKEAKQLRLSAHTSDQWAIAESDEYNSKQHEAVPHAKLSAQEDRKQAKEAKAAVPARRLSAKEYQEQQDRYFAALNAGVKKTARVVDAERHASRPAKLSAKAYKAEQHKYFDALDKEANEQTVRAKRQKKIAKLTMKQARLEQEEYFKSLDSQDHITARVRRAERVGKEEARHVEQITRVEDEEEARKIGTTHEAVPREKLNAKQALAQQERYFEQLAAAVHKAPEVIKAEAEAKAAAKTDGLSGAASRAALDSDMKRITLKHADESRAHSVVEVAAHLRAALRKEVMEGDVPEVEGKLKLHWKGREAAADLYKKLKNKALATKGGKGRPMDSKHEWDKHKTGIVDKMEQEFKDFKI